MNNESIELLCNIRSVTNLVEMRTEVGKLLSESMVGRKETECEYCERKSRIDTLQEITDMINKKIELITKQALV